MNSIRHWIPAALILAMSSTIAAEDDKTKTLVPLTPIQGGAAQVVLPPKGVALGYPEPCRIPDSFCEIEEARSLEEIPPRDKPRCCDDEGDGRPCNSCNKSSDSANQMSSNSGSPIKEEQESAYLAVFDDAAHFSTADCPRRRRWRYMSCSFETPYVIYEGMTVRIKDNGCYEVRALIDGPHIPAILRLQLRFSVDGNEAVVTLPPIRLSVDDLEDNHLPNETHTWYVRRTGFSHRLSHLLADFNMLTVRRNGTAQVGQIPEL